MRGLLFVIACALALAPTAAARTDGPRQLALEWPARGHLNSHFGWDGGRWHTGFDIGMLRTLDVTAATDGTVVATGWLGGYEGYGNVVLVRFDDEYSLLYAHLARPLVRTGDRITAGERIGIAGCTGWCTGTHLHFELRYRGAAIDPATLFAR